MMRKRCGRLKALQTVLIVIDRVLRTRARLDVHAKFYTARRLQASGRECPSNGVTPSASGPFPQVKALFW